MAKTNWDLTILYSNEADFDADLEAFKALGPKAASFQGKLNDEEAFANYLRLDKKATELLVKLYYFASMRSDLNKKDVANATALTKVQLAMNEFYALTSFASPEILSLGEDKLKDFLQRNPEFAEYSFQFEKLIRGQSHVLSADKEALLSSYSPLLSEAGKLYSALTVADLSPKEATLSDGSKVLVTQSNWSSLIAKTKKAEDRQAIFEALYEYYDLHKSTYGEIYSLGLQSQLAVKKSRGYDSILQSHLYDNAIPESVFHSLIEVASTHTEPLKKYYRLRAKALGLEKHRSYDRFLHLADAEEHYTYEEARDLFYESIKRFPAYFQEKAHEATKDGYVDVYPQDGKRTGAYSNGGNDLHPFILLNFNGELDDVFTLAHEAGHSGHTLFAEETQPTLLQDYTIFVAEIASTFNEHNLLDYLLQNGKLTKNDRIFLLQKAIDEICGTFYRQTLFAHFESLMAEKAEKGEPVNFEVCSQTMVDLYKRYYDIDITEEKLKPLCWAYMPHIFYSPFYVYQYATSFTSSMLIYERVNKGEEGAFEAYIDLLRSGGSDYPVNQVKKAGVDLTSPEPFLAVVRRMEDLVDQLEKVLAE